MRRVFQISNDQFTQSKTLIPPEGTLWRIHFLWFWGSVGSTAGSGALVIGVAYGTDQYETLGAMNVGTANSFPTGSLDFAGGGLKAGGGTVDIKNRPIIIGNDDYIVLYPPSSWGSTGYGVRIHVLEEGV